MDILIKRLSAAGCPHPAASDIILQPQGEDTLRHGYNAIAGGFKVKRFSIILIITAFLLIVSAEPAIAEDNNVTSRRSRFLFLPLLGYQSMDGEQIGFNYNFYQEVSSFGMDTISTASGTENRERNVRVPMFGLMYRFRPNYQLNCDATLAIIHDGTSNKYRIDILFFKRTTSLEVRISRGNTVLGMLELGYNIPLPGSLMGVNMKWLGLSVSGGLGYALRSIKVHNDYQNVLTINHKNSESMLSMRFSGDLTLWRQDQLVIMGSLFYTRFIPSDSDIDPFGGVGWRMAVFPIWSAI